MCAPTVGQPHRLGSRFFFEGSSCAHFVLQSYHGRRGKDISTTAVRIGAYAPVAAIVTAGRPEPAKLTLASLICAGANCRVITVRPSVPLLKICISHRPRNPPRTCAESEDCPLRLSR